MKGYTLVPLNWIGKIDCITITSVLPTENMLTTPHYLNIWQIRNKTGKSPIIKRDITKKPKHI